MQIRFLEAERNPVTRSVRLETVPCRAIAVVRRRASAAQLAMIVPEACGVVWNYVRAHHIAGAGRHVAVYRDDAINLEAGVELDSPFTGDGEVVASSTPAGLVATATHLGPYGGLHETHQAILQFCKEQGYELAGPSWEVYGHWQDDWGDDPSQIRTDVFYLVRKSGS